MHIRSNPALDLEEDENERREQEDSTRDEEVEEEEILTAHRNSRSCRVRSAWSPNRSPGN